MADQLLSVQSEHLEQIANEIRSKTNTNGKLEFPNGFINAINSIDTYANAIDKVPPQTITLTPANTSYTVPAGTHDGTDVVKIKIKSDTIELIPSEQEVFAEATGDEFLGTVLVKAIETSAGKKVATGIETFNSASTTFQKTNLGFQPEGAIIMLQSYGSNINIDKVTCVATYNGPGDRTGYFGSSNHRSLFSRDSVIILNNDSISYTPKNTDASATPVFYGTYYYIIWGE